MSAVDTITRVGRGLLRIIMLYAAVVAVAVAAMAGFATDSLAVTAAVLAPVLMTTMLIFGPRLVRWRGAQQRRRLRQQVGDPLTLAGDWRRLLLDAWSARDEFATAVTGYADSPIGDRLGGHQPLVDAALVQCGELARSGHRLDMQLKAFRPRRLRRDLLLERRRGRSGQRVAALTRQLDDVERLRGDLDRVRGQLEMQVHDLRTAAWRAATLPPVTADQPEAALRELLEDLDHLEAALAEVDAPGPHATAPNPHATAPGAHASGTQQHATAPDDHATTSDRHAGARTAAPS